MTKWRIKRLPDVEGKISFSWEQCDHLRAAKWDWEKIQKAVEEMKTDEEKIIEIL